MMEEEELFVPDDDLMDGHEFLFDLMDAKFDDLYVSIAAF